MTLLGWVRVSICAEYADAVLVEARVEAGRGEDAKGGVDVNERTERWRVLLDLTAVGLALETQLHTARSRAGPGARTRNDMAEEDKGRLGFYASIPHPLHRLSPKRTRDIT